MANLEQLTSTNWAEKG